MKTSWKSMGGGGGRLVVGLVLGAWAAAAAPLYQNDFTQAELEKVPEDFLVLDGQFAVKQEGADRFLELPGAPLETFGVLFGPSQKDGLTVFARIWGTSRGRRYPVFAVSLGGVSGFRLQISPAKKAAEILKGDLVIASAAFEWQSGRWTHLRLQVRKTGDAAWSVEGKAWGEGGAEPAPWTVTAEVTEEPVQGKPGVWGQPFAGTSIRFDDLRVTALGEK